VITLQSELKTNEKKDFPLQARVSNSEGMKIKMRDNQNNYTTDERRIFILFPFWRRLLNYQTIPSETIRFEF
jgi:hypothetical protein